MQNYRRIRRRPIKTMRVSYFMLLTCVCLFLASCANPFDTTISTSATNGTGSQSGDAASSSYIASAKTDAQGVKMEETNRVRQAKVLQIMKGMTLEQKLGQLLMVEYEGSVYANTDLPYMISNQFVGGYLYQPVNHNFDAPYNTPDMAKTIATLANADAKIPLLVAIDQEGGKVQKLTTLFSDTPSAEKMALSADSVGVTAQGKQDAQWMTQVGINTNLAPVADVGPDTNLLLDRMFGSDPQTVTTYAGAFLDGLQQNGVIGTLKHFPGLGSLRAGQDPHAVLPINYHTLADLQKTDLAPYKTLIQQNNPAMIMTTDVIDTAIDPTYPAELSTKTVNGLLRQQLGYNGVVITDGLYMGGITNRWTIPQAAVLAIEAGNDIVEGPYTSLQVSQVVEALKLEITNGTLTQDRVDQSVQRILMMKTQYGIIK